MSEQIKIYLTEDEIPKKWYNITADLSHPVPPPLHPKTRQPAKPEDLTPIFPMSLIEQEVSTERWIAVPDEVRELYAMYRPSPLFRARRLEEKLKTPAKIYYKHEGVSPAGSHKPNTAIPQAYYNKKAGKKRIATETGAGQWGSALSLACNFFEMGCTVYMVKVSYEQKPYRRSMMEAWGAEVFASPSKNTRSGQQILEKDPDSMGSLGMAISEAVEDAVAHDDTSYALGSVLNHVMLHQTIIGLEAKKQMAKIGQYPDVVIGCCGGGSNFAGLSFPFLADKFAGRQLKALAVEPTACPTLTRGVYAFDYGDTAGLTPLLKMYTLGHDFVPPGIHAGGLRYHGGSPILCQLVHDGLIEAVAYPQNPVFEAAIMFTRTEGILPAPESAHAIRAAVDEALRAKEEGREKVILFNLSGHGHLDLSSYDNYFTGKLQDFSYSEELLAASLANLPKVE